jgi:DNA helicase HerA-like ATPase
LTLSRLPAAAHTRHIAFLGKTGAGKTYGARGEVEQLLANGERVCIVDPTGVWWGLRLSAGGNCWSAPQ